MAMTPSDIAALSRLLDEGCELEPGQVPAWLDGLAPEHAVLRARLRDLLADRASPKALEFLREGPRLDAGPEPDDPTSARVGDLVGPYRLIRELGRGGMGAVWLAERHDGALKRPIALKLPRLAWGADLSRRMARERDIGALLEHPHIARLYDAGVDERGRPYLALEYIDGVGIDEWCRVQALPIRDRLTLFVQVVRAVAYAHGRLIVHRDLKPSNVLVSADGQAHLLDFGIAKMLDEERGDDGLTQAHERMLTPRYASPEQRAGRPVTVASDVYSLGALLVDLLWSEARRYALRDSGASDRLDLRDLDSAQASAALQGVSREGSREILAMLAKALHDDPAKRYATADAFAEDIARHLRGDAVLARPDSFAYRSAKVLSRHRGAVVAACAVLVAVLTGAGTALWQARRANAEAEQARAVKEYLIDLFDAKTGPDGSLAVMPAAALIERGARNLETKFAGRPALRSELYGVLSRMFFNIGNFEQSLAYGSRHIEMLKALDAPRTEIANALLWLPEVQIPMESGDPELPAREALAWLGPRDPAAAHAHAVIAAALLLRDGDVERAAVELDSADRIVASMHVSPLAQAKLANVRALWHSFRDQPEAAMTSIDRAIALGLQAEGPHSVQALLSQLQGAQVMLGAGRADAGKRYLAAGLAGLRSLGGDAKAAFWEAEAFQWLWSSRGATFAEAIAVCDRSLATLAAQRWGAPPMLVARTKLAKGFILSDWGDVTRALPLLEENIEPSGGTADLATWEKRRSLALTLMLTDRAADAPALARQALAVTRNTMSIAFMRRTYTTLAMTHIHLREYDQARAAMATFRALPGAAGHLSHRAARGLGPLLPDLLVALETAQFDDVVRITEGLREPIGTHDGEAARLARAAALCAIGRGPEARALFAAWLPRLADDRYEASPELAYWRARMGSCALDSGDLKAARDASRQASAALAKQPGVSPHYRAQVVTLQARVGR